MKYFYKEHPEYSVIHSHIDSLSAFPLYASKKNNIPIRIAHSYTSQFEFDKNLPLKSLVRKMLPKATNIYCTSGIQTDRLLYGEKIHEIIRNAIDVERFSFDEAQRTKKREELGIKDDFVIGHVGAYCHEKNQSFLIDVFNEISK